MHKTICVAIIIILAIVSKLKLNIAN